MFAYTEMDVHHMLKMEVHNQTENEKHDLPLPPRVSEIECVRLIGIERVLTNFRTHHLGHNLSEHMQNSFISIQILPDPGISFMANSAHGLCNHHCRTLVTYSEQKRKTHSSLSPSCSEVLCP